MEHRLITGGEQYLPFARSCVAKLKKLGIPYADQSYEVDGVSIKVRLEPGHEYIRLDGTPTVSMEMDSGVIEAGNIAELNPDTYLAGTLREDGAAEAYCAPFVPTEKGGRKNPGDGGIGQLAGAITHGKRFVGEILNPLSFAPGKIPVVPATTPPTFTDNPHDDALRGKKMTAVICPASIFTGKCRLYVQAMYGTALYPRDPSVKAVNPYAESSTTAAPVLWLDSYTRKGDDVGYPDIMLDTSSGVWLDKDTGKHWLFKPHDGVLDVYPLMSIPAGESLRKYLKDSVKTLNAEDKHHLEAYILGYSRPDGRYRQRAAGDVSTGGTYSMGYGWHWNWSGTTADVVINNTYEQDAEHQGMRSTHYRLTYTREDLAEPDGGFPLGAFRQNWSVKINVVEGPTEWAVYKAYWTIAEPDFNMWNLSKTTPRYTSVFPCNAPFYAFYKKDELIVCRVSVVYHAAEEPGEPTYINCTPRIDGQPDCVTIGMNEGARIVAPWDGWHFSAVFSAGGYSTPPIPVGKVTHAESVISVTNKVKHGWIAGYGSGYFGTRTFSTTDDFGGSPSEVTEFSQYLDITQSANITFDTTRHDAREEHWGLLTAVVPIGDSEAVYIQSNKRRDVFVEQNTVYHMTHTLKGPIGAFLTREVTSVSTPGGYILARSCGAFAASGPEIVSVDYNIPDPEYITESSDEVLFCGAGVVPAVFTHMNEFHNNELDSIGTSFETRTSTYDPVIIHAPTNAPSATNTSAWAPVIVGWV